MNVTLPRIHHYLVEQSKPAAFYVSLLLVALVGLLDYVTGLEISLSFLYLIPVAFAT